MTTPLWQPTLQQIEQSQLFAFQKLLESKYAVKFSNYDALHTWSVENPHKFWESCAQFCEVEFSSPATATLQRAELMPGARWFKGAELNFAENLLRYRDDEPAIVSRLENGQRSVLTYTELHDQVASLSCALRALGVNKGDRIAGFLPNVAETVIAMLATTSIGAIWSSCSPDFGKQGVMDRFEQIEPKVLFACNGYYYNGKTINCTAIAKHLLSEIASLETLVIVPAIITPDTPHETNIHLWPELIREHACTEITFTPLPFDHPLYILYSSGTTGVPKCIVHSAGGTLIQHLKEHKLHCDLRRDDVFFYFTTCGWMMWNWLVSGLANGCTLVLYDGSPFYPDANCMWDMANAENISVFGTSAKYLSALEKSGCKPVNSHNLDNLRLILSTGSPLSPESFAYVYKDVKQDLCLSSISGGTDIVSCFALGNCCLPVYAGELQCLGLGLDVDVFDEQNVSVVQIKGELVCRQPFPSMPIGFWNDPDQSKYLNAYFNQIPGVWAHGDYAEITQHKGMVIYGRSDAVLNPGGVRIGTAEIYRQVEKLDSILESICIGQQWRDDVRVILFVVLRSGLTLNDRVEQEIRSSIRTHTTPRHVPAIILQVTEIPKTISGKIVELAVRKVVHNQIVSNTDALANPDALEQFRNLPELQ